MSARSQDSTIAAMDDTIQAFLDQRGAGGLPLGWAVVLEHLTEEGERQLSLVVSQDARSWQVLGWLRYASELLLESARIEERDSTA